MKENDIHKAPKKKPIKAIIFMDFVVYAVFSTTHFSELEDLGEKVNYFYKV